MKYLRDYDFRVEGGPQAGQVRLVDIDRALELISEAELARLRDGRIAAGLGPGVAGRATRALLQVYGTRQVGSEVLGAIRDGNGQLYVPGSSLKGWFRSALLDAWVAGHRSQALDEVRQALARKQGRERAAAGLEEAAFKVDLPRTNGVQFPNLDINRWVHISDAYSRGGMQAGVCEIQVRSETSRGRQAIPVWAECILPGSEFAAEVKFSSAALFPWSSLDEERKRLFGNDVVGLLREHSRHLAEEEGQYWRRRDPAIGNGFEGALRGSSTGVYFPLGFGTGWVSKTVGRHLRGDPGLMKGLLETYRLSRAKSPDPATFPVGHRVVDGPGGWLPMGWVALKEVAQL